MGMADKYKYFTEAELRCRDNCGLGQDDMDSMTMAKAIYLRVELETILPNDPWMPISSAVRCPIHDLAVSTSKQKGRGPHTKEISPEEEGQGFDVKCWGIKAYWILALAQKHGFTGVGLNQKGLYYKRFIHLDDLPNMPGCKRPWTWSY